MPKVLMDLIGILFWLMIASGMIWLISAIIVRIIENIEDRRHKKKEKYLQSTDRNLTPRDLDEPPKASNDPAHVHRVIEARKSARPDPDKVRLIARERAARERQEEEISRSRLVPRPVRRDEAPRSTTKPYDDNGATNTTLYINAGLLAQSSPVESRDYSHTTYHGHGGDAGGGGASASFDSGSSSSSDSGSSSSSDSGSSSSSDSGSSSSSDSGSSSSGSD